MQLRRSSEPPQLYKVVHGTAVVLMLPIIMKIDVIFRPRFTVYCSRSRSCWDVFPQTEMEGRGRVERTEDNDISDVQPDLITKQHVARHREIVSFEHRRNSVVLELAA